MIRRIPLASAVLASCVALPVAAADGISNSYVDFRYLNTVQEYDTGTANPPDDEVEGWEGSASVGLAEFLNFTATYDSHRYARGRDGYASAGLAGHTTARTWQAFGAVTYEQLEFDRTVGPGLQEATQDGAGVTLGGKFKLPSFEVMAAAKYARYSDYFSAGLTALSYEIGAGLQLTPYWEATFGGRYRDLEVEPETGSSLNVLQMEWSAGFRRYFITSGDKWKRTGGIFSWGNGE